MRSGNGYLIKVWTGLWCVGVRSPKFEHTVLRQRPDVLTTRLKSPGLETSRKSPSVQSHRDPRSTRGRDVIDVTRTRNLYGVTVRSMSTGPEVWTVSLDDDVLGVRRPRKVTMLPVSTVKTTRCPDKGDVTRPEILARSIGQVLEIYPTHNFPKGSFRSGTSDFING